MIKALAVFFIRVEIVFCGTTDFPEVSLFAIPFSIWQIVSHFTLRIYLLAFFPQQTSFSITIDSEQSFLNIVHSKISSI